MRVLSAKEAAEKLGIGTTNFYEGIKDGRYPRPINVSPGRVGFVEEEIDACIARMMRDRDEKLQAA